jgi:arsenate reductase-like glutaredoxin family protein
MVYELYTWPNCSDCREIKDFFKDRGIDYTEIDLLNPEGKKVFGKIYNQIDGKVQRKLNNNAMILPLLVDLVVEDGKKNVKRFAQEYKGIRALFPSD